MRCIKNALHPPNSVPRPRQTTEAKSMGLEIMNAKVQFPITTGAPGLVSGSRTARVAMEQRDAMMVAERQPHRVGSLSARRGTALGRFCQDHKPRPLGEHCYAAGERYAEIVREYKNAMGFDVPGWAPSDKGYTDLTEAQIAAKKELARQRKDDADAILRRVMTRLPHKMELLVFDDRDLGPYDGGVIAAGLIMLANDWRMSPRSFAER